MREHEAEALPKGVRPQGVAAGPVMLALSTFRRSQAAVELAMQKAEPPEPLVIVFVVDENLARYYIGSGVGLYPHT